ncbi:MAG: hypothetical protein EPN94_11040, partial [Nitrospirae bacterium]
MRINTVKTTFTGGEIDPLLYGRMETPRYQDGCEKLLNVFVLPTGGATRRYGMRFIKNAGAGITTRRIPFVILKKDAVPPVTQGYKVEIRSDNKIRFYTNKALILNGGNPYEINSPYTGGADLKKIRFAQFDNILYLTHPDFPPQQLTRTSDTSWAIAAVNFTQPTPPHWDATTGYPCAIAFFEQRMVLGGTKAKPQTIILSKSGDPLYLVTGTGDGDAFTYLLVPATAPIYHLAATKQITVFTAMEEIFIFGSSDKSLTPTNIQVKKRRAYGSTEGNAPLVFGDSIFYATKYARKLRQLSYDFATDSYQAPDQSIVASHFLKNTSIRDMDAVTEPLSLILILTESGDLLAVTYDKDQDVTAWSKCQTDGVIKDFCVIPGATEDEVWLSVERAIGGTTYTHTEVMDSAL